MKVCFFKSEAIVDSFNVNIALAISEHLLYYFEDPITTAVRPYNVFSKISYKLIGQETKDMTSSCGHGT